MARPPCLICNGPNATLRCLDCDAWLHQRCVDLQWYKLEASPVGGDDEHAYPWVDGSMMAQLEVAAFSADGRSLLGTEQFDSLRDQWQQRLDDARKTPATVHDGGGGRREDRLHLLIASSQRNDPRDVELAGCAFGRIEGKDSEFYIDMVVVLPRFARRGGAAALLASIEASVRAFGAAGVVAPQRLSLIVGRENAAAQRVYQRAGFRVGAWPPGWGWSQDVKHLAMFKTVVYDRATTVE